MSRVALVVGAQGVLGHLTAEALATAGWRVLRAGRRPEADPSFRLLDLADAESVARASAGVDLVVSTVPHPALALERTILRQGGALVSVASLDAAARATLEAEAPGAPGLVVVHAGLAPGVTTLAAADLLATHPEADAVEVGLTFSKASVSGRTGAAFAFRLLTARAHHPTTVIPLPPPFGLRRCMNVGMESEGWFGRLAGQRATALFICLAERSLHAGLLAANDLHLLGRLPRRLFVPPDRPLPAAASREAVCEWVAVRRAGRCLGAATVEGEGDYRSTAAATAVQADVVLAARARVPAPRGVVGPEALCTLADVRAPLAAAGVRVTARG